MQRGRRDVNVREAPRHKVTLANDRLRSCSPWFLPDVRGRTARAHGSSPAAARGRRRPHCCGLCGKGGRRARSGSARRQRGGRDGLLHAVPPSVPVASRPPERPVLRNDTDRPAGRSHQWLPAGLRWPQWHARRIMASLIERRSCQESRISKGYPSRREAVPLGEIVTPPGSPERCPHCIRPDVPCVWA